MNSIFLHYIFFPAQNRILILYFICKMFCMFRNFSISFQILCDDYEIFLKLRELRYNYIDVTDSLPPSLTGHLALSATSTLFLDRFWRTLRFATSNLIRKPFLVSFTTALLSLTQKLLEWSIPNLCCLWIALEVLYGFATYDLKWKTLLMSFTATLPLFTEKKHKNR